MLFATLRHEQRYKKLTILQSFMHFENFAQLHAMKRAYMSRTKINHNVILCILKK